MWMLTIYNSCYGRGGGIKPPNGAADSKNMDGLLHYMASKNITQHTSEYVDGVV